MKKIPYKLCGTCGLYNGVAVQTCECGADLSQVPALLVDGEIPKERYGEIDASAPVYVQKCSACGAENFTADPSKRVRVCYNCHKARVAMVAPVPFQSEEEPAGSEEDPSGKGTAVFQPPVQTSGEVVEEPEDENGGVQHWQGLLDGVQEAVRGAPVAPTRPAAPPAPVEPDDDEDDDTGSWGSLLGVSPAPPEPGTAPVTPAPPRKQELTLTALRYGSMTLTLTEGQKGLPYLLGRSEGCWEFLIQDPRVSNQHCYLDFRGGVWVVIDNHSTNGTAVNGQFLAENGQRTLCDGDELMLGHHPDSMAFRVTIR